MVNKTYDLPEIGKLTVVKRRGNRNIRLSFDANGNLRASLPPYAPYRAALTFANSKKAWIAKHRPQPPASLSDGHIILKNYRLVFKPTASARRATSRLLASQIIISYPDSLAIISEQVQAAANRGINRVIKLEAEGVLIARIAELAKIHDYKYKSVKIKSLKRRWGSCDTAGNITLNQYLVQLAPEQIDYVLLHELAHTLHHHHQEKFWQEMRAHLPETDQLKKQVRSAQPGLALAD